jgi:hypothetical protein
VEDGCLNELGLLQLPTVDGVNDGTRVCDAHAGADTVTPTSPTGVDQPSVGALGLYVFGEGEGGGQTDRFTFSQYVEGNRATFVHKIWRTSDVRVCDAHAAAHTVTPASPTGVDQPLEAWVPWACVGRVGFGGGGQQGGRREVCRE